MKSGKVVAPTFFPLSQNPCFWGRRINNHVVNSGWSCEYSLSSFPKPNESSFPSRKNLPKSKNHPFPSPKQNPTSPFPLDPPSLYSRKKKNLPFLPHSQHTSTPLVNLNLEALRCLIANRWECLSGQTYWWYDHLGSLRSPTLRQSLRASLISPEGHE